ncbi:MAG: hypothetical protein GXP49_03935 [Deltaproteobacteria bacterium]|nr:hypothetical protein [Deltaproteobacteria bacterium]
MRSSVVFGSGVTSMSGILTISICYLLISISSWPCFAWDGQNRQVTLQDLLPHLMDMEAYGEQWSFDNEIGENQHISFQIVISNLGIGDHKAEYKVWFKGTPNNQTYKNGSCKLKSGISNVSGRRMASLQCGPLKILEDLKGAIATFSSKELSFYVKINSCSPPWRPGSGRVRLGKGQKFYDLLIQVPRGTMTGTVITRKNKLAVSGVSFADHSITTVIIDLAKSCIKFKKLSPEYNLVFVSFNPPEADRFSYLLAADAKCRLFESPNPRLEIISSFPTPNRKKYKVPSKFEITADDSDAGSIIINIFKGHIKKIKDMLASLNSVERFVARRYSDPFVYYMTGLFRVTWKKDDRTILSFEHENPYTVEHYNP